jgi:hypothetical protein
MCQSIVMNDIPILITLCQRLMVLFFNGFDGKTVSIEMSDILLGGRKLVSIVRFNVS